MFAIVASLAQRVNELDKKVREKTNSMDMVALARMLDRAKVCNELIRSCKTIHCAAVQGMFKANFEANSSKNVCTLRALALRMVSRLFTIQISFEALGVELKAGGYSKDREV